MVVVDGAVDETSFNVFSLSLSVVFPLDFTPPRLSFRRLAELMFGMSLTSYSACLQLKEIISEDRSSFELENHGTETDRTRVIRSANNAKCLTSGIACLPKHSAYLLTFDHMFALSVIRDESDPVAVVFSPVENKIPAFTTSCDNIWNKKRLPASAPSIIYRNMSTVVLQSN